MKLPRLSNPPKCFDSQTQYDLWLEAARKCANVNKADKEELDQRGPCADCTVAYQRRMIRSDRCERPTIRVRDRE